MPLQSHYRSIVAIVATLAVLVAIPATASAKSSKSGAPAVKAHVVKAKKSLKRLTRAVDAHDARVALVELRRARKHATAASKAARRMAGRATEGSPSVVAAQTLALVGTLYTSLAETTTGLVDEATGEVQAVLAQAISSVMAGKQMVVHALARLIDLVPVAVEPALASVITALSLVDGSVANISDALAGTGLPGDISALLSHALATGTQTLQLAFDSIKSIIPMLPAEIQAPIAAIVGMITQVSGSISPSVLSTASGLVGQILGALPFVGDGSGIGLGSLLGTLVGDSSVAGLDLGGLLGGLFPSDGGDGTSSGGVGGIIATITNLVTSLLGGLLS